MDIVTHGNIQTILQKNLLQKNYNPKILILIEIVEHNGLYVK